MNGNKHWFNNQNENLDLYGDGVNEADATYLRARLVPVPALASLALWWFPFLRLNLVGS